MLAEKQWFITVLIAVSAASALSAQEPTAQSPSSQLQDGSGRSILQTLGELDVIVIRGRHEDVEASQELLNRIITEQQTAAQLGGEYAAAEQRAAELAAKIRAGETSEQVSQHLRQIVRTAFRLRQQLQAKRIAAARLQITVAEERLKRRDALSDAIVRRRVEELISAEDLSWLPSDVQGSAKPAAASDADGEVGASVGRSSPAGDELAKIKQEGGTRLRLLELDYQQAEIRHRLAQAEYQESVYVNKRSPGAIPSPQLRRQQLKVDEAELELERARTLLDAHRQEQREDKGELDKSRADEIKPALEGYCPVALIEKQTWQQGDSRWGAVHQGRLYLFASRANQQQFLADPESFSPALSGNDPVLFAETGQLSEGSRLHGVMFHGRYFLFSDDASREKFVSDPARYYSTAVQEDAHRTSETSP